ncbi:hypothetical protein DFH09DRAFT_1365427 [Mycena vulgaris]|nr:hypothetical protein DFH09DRAFT_1365427 [Mycena vulgaris]
MQTTKLRWNQGKNAVGQGKSIASRYILHVIVTLDQSGLPTTTTLTVEGASVPSFSYVNIPRTVLSPSFISGLGPSRPTGYLFTVTVGPSGSFSFPLHCTLGPQSPFDVVLGYDWAAHLRDRLLHYGFRLDSQFDAWKFFSYHLPPPPGPSAAAIPTPPAPIGPSPPYVHPATSSYYPAPFSQYGTYPPQPLMTASYFLSAPSFLVPTSYYPLARSQYSTSSYYPPSSTYSSNANTISWYHPSNSSPSSTAGYDGVIQKSWFTRSTDPTRYPKKQGYFFMTVYPSNGRRGLKALKREMNLMIGQLLQSVVFMERLDKNGNGEKCMTYAMVALQYSALQSDVMPARGIGYSCDVSASGCMVCRHRRVKGHPNY